MLQRDNVKIFQAAPQQVHKVTRFNLFAPEVSEIQGRKPNGVRPGCPGLVPRDGGYDVRQRDREFLNRATPQQQPGASRRQHRQQTHGWPTHAFSLP